MDADNEMGRAHRINGKTKTMPAASALGSRAATCVLATHFEIKAGIENCARI